MKTEFEKLKLKCAFLNIEEVEEEVSKFVDTLFESVDIKLISISKKWCGYGTWKSEAYVNNYGFGDELASIIRKKLSGRITHDEDKVFEVEDYRDELKEAIFESM